MEEDVREVDRSSVRYGSIRPDGVDLRDAMKKIAGERRRFGYRRIHLMLERQGIVMNQKKLRRLYREEKLQVRKRGGGLGLGHPYLLQRPFGFRLLALRQPGEQVKPGKPMQNGFVILRQAQDEGFNGSFRDECLNETLFSSFTQAPAQILAWKENYNRNRPHSSLGNLTPSEFNMKMTLQKQAA